MPPVAAQNMSPVEHLGKSRLLISIVALIAVAFILVALSIYMQNGQKLWSSASNHQELMRQAIMSQLSNARPATPATVKQITAQLNAANTTVTNEQRTAIMNQLQAAH